MPQLLYFKHFSTSEVIMKQTRKRKHYLSMLKIGTLNVKMQHNYVHMEETGNLENSNIPPPPKSS
jgi:hypothetical protein